MLNTQQNYFFKITNKRLKLIGARAGTCTRSSFVSICKSDDHALSILIENRTVLHTILFTTVASEINFFYIQITERKNIKNSQIINKIEIMWNKIHE